MSKITRINLTVRYTNADGEFVTRTEKDITVLFNKTIISQDEVEHLINSGMYEYDERIIVVSTRQANNLIGISNDDFKESESWLN